VLEQESLDQMVLTAHRSKKGNTELTVLMVKASTGSIGATGANG
jgi:hypothetical protein